jgi:hypothetical protein
VTGGGYFDRKLTSAPAAVWVMPLITDLFIFLLTLWRTRNYMKLSRSTPCVVIPKSALIEAYNVSSTINIFLRDGIIYFFTIFMANLLNTLIYFVSPTVFFCPHILIMDMGRSKLAVNDLRAIGASFSQMITATMISRLVLNLRSSSGLPPGEPTEAKLPRGPMRFMQRTVGSLGGELESAFDHVYQDSTSDEITMEVLTTAEAQGRIY